MRGLHSTIALLVVLIGLGAYIYFVTWKQSDATDAASKQEKVFASLEADKIEELKIKAEKGDNTTVVKKDGAWQLTQPITAKADDSEVSTITSGLTQASIVRVVDENPADLKEYGLATPRLEVDFKASGDKDYRKLLADDAAPTDLKKYGLDKPDVTVNVNAGSARATLLVGGKAADGTIYVRDVSRSMVMTAESSLIDDLKKGADEYRRKDIFEFRSYNATRVELTRNGQTVVFEKAKGQGENPQDTWRRVSPAAANADKDKVESLLSRLSNMRATSFAESTAKTGLDKPELTVYVKFDDSKKEERVSFGKSGEDVYASRPAEPGAAKVDATDLTEALKTLDEIAK